MIKSICNYLSMEQWFRAITNDDDDDNEIRNQNNSKFCG